MRVEKAGIQGKAVAVSMLTGMAVCMAVLLAGTFIFAWLIGAEHIGESSAVYAVMVVTAVASVAGSATAAAMAGHHLLPVCIGTSAGFFLVLLAMTALLFGGQYHGVGETALLIIGSGAVVSLVKTYSKEKRNSACRKRRNR